MKKYDKFKQNDIEKSTILALKLEIPEKDIGKIEHWIEKSNKIFQKTTIEQREVDQKLVERIAFDYSGNETFQLTKYFPIRK